VVEAHPVHEDEWRPGAVIPAVQPDESVVAHPWATHQVRTCIRASSNGRLDWAVHEPFKLVRLRAALRVVLLPVTVIAQFNDLISNSAD
jgi:hypothetical protein